MFPKEVTHVWFEVLCKGMSEVLTSHKYRLKGCRREKVEKYSIQGNEDLDQSSRAEREFMWLKRKKEHFGGNLYCFK